VATETAKFALDLDDGISASSEAAEDSLKSLQDQIDKDNRALSQMKKAMREMQAGSSVDISAYKRLKDQLDVTQNSIAKNRAAFINLGGDFAKLGHKKPPKPPEVAKPTGLEDMLSAANALPGPLADVSKGVVGVTSKVSGLAAAVGVAGGAIIGVVAAMTMLVAALVAVAAATAKATVELTKYAVAQADAMRSERLRLEGLGTLRRWMRLTSTDAAEMSESINRVAERVPLSRSAIAGYGQELHRLGIRGRAAEDALEALSIAQAVQGDLGRQRLMMLVRMAGHSEGAMRNLSMRVRKELGSVAAAQMRSLTMISTKLGESLRALVAGVKIDTLLGGLYRLSRLLSQSTESGRALRAILSTVLGVFVGELATTTPMVEYLFKELVIVALKAAIAFFVVKNAITDAFGDNLLARLISSQKAIEGFKIGIIAVGLIITSVAAVLVGFGLVLVGLLTPFVVIAYAMYRGYQRAQELYASFLRLRGLFSPAGWIASGQAMVQGIVQGLTAGAAQLRAAVTSVATDAMGAFRNALGIHSPSAVFRNLGLAIPRGIVQGIELGSSEASAAAGRVVSTASETRNTVSTTTNNVRSIQGGQSRSVSVGELHVHVGRGEGEGEGSGEDTARRVTDALREFFDSGLATEMP